MGPVTTIRPDHYEDNAAARIAAQGKYDPGVSVGDRDTGDIYVRTTAGWLPIRLAGAGVVIQADPATGNVVQLLNGGLRTADVYAPAREIFIDWFFGADDALVTLTAANSYGNGFLDMSTINVNQRAIVIINGNAAPSFSYTVDFSRNAVASATDDTYPVITATASTSRFTRIILDPTKGYDQFARLGITPDAGQIDTQLQFKAYLVGRGG